MAGEDLFNRVRGREPEAAATGTDPVPFRAMIDIERKGGQRHAFPYSYLLWVEFDPAAKITLHFSTHTVEVHGRGLRSLYDALMLHAVPKIVEAGRDAWNLAPDGTMVIERIEVRAVS